MYDIYDIIALGLFGAILAVSVQVVVTLGSLSGQVARFLPPRVRSAL